MAGHVYGRSCRSSRSCCSSSTAQQQPQPLLQRPDLLPRGPAVFAGHCLDRGIPDGPLHHRQPQGGAPAMQPACHRAALAAEQQAPRPRPACPYCAGALYCPSPFPFTAPSLIRPCLPASPAPCPPARLPACLQHYSVDVIVAFYTVPLVFYTMHRRWTTKRPVQDYWCAGAAPPTRLARGCASAGTGCTPCGAATAGSADTAPSVAGAFDPPSPRPNCPALAALAAGPTGHCWATRRLSWRQLTLRTRRMERWM